MQCLNHNPYHLEAKRNASGITTLLKKSCRAVEHAADDLFLRWRLVQKFTRWMGPVYYYSSLPDGNNERVFVAVTLPGLPRTQ